MIAGSILNSVTAIVGMFATIAIIVTALGLILGMLKPADALRQGGLILAIVILLDLLPEIIASEWIGLSLRQRLGIAALFALGVWMVLSRAQSPKR